MPDLIDLPKTLLPFKKDILATVKPLNFVVCEENGPQAFPWSSRAGWVNSVPYLPLDQEYPKSKTTGHPLRLLAQINYEEMPPLEGFPDKGLLQVFASDVNDVKRNQWGMDEEDSTNQDNFRVIYHPVLNTDLSQLQTIGQMQLPLFDHQQRIGCPVSFAEGIQPLSDSDMNFETVYPQKLKDKLLYHVPTRKAYLEMLRPHSQIGGYHYSQNGIDPREAVDGMEKSVLLLQLANPFSWGDGGNAVFFISEKDLAARKFDRIIYHWDCT